MTKPPKQVSSWRRNSGFSTINYDNCRPLCPFLWQNNRKGLILYDFLQSHNKDGEIRLSIAKAIDSSIELRNKKELIEKFIDSLKPGDDDVDNAWHSYVQLQKETELNDIIAEENLKPELTKKFIDASFRDGAIRESGTELASILPPMSRFDRNRAQKKDTVLGKLKAFFEKFKDII